MENYINKQLTEGYNGKLNALFDEWIASYREEDEAGKRFVKDGLVIKHKEEASGYNINKKWDESERRIMFIVKDCPDGEEYDARRLFVGYPNNEKSQINAKNVRNVKGAFFKNIARILHGLWILTQENKGTDDIFDKIDNNKAAQIKAFDEIPFAFVEGKKLAGDKNCPPQELQKALEHDGQYLAKEIEILRPNIVVCCDQDGIIFNSVVQNYFNDRPLDKDHKWEYRFGGADGFDCKLYYYEEENILLFNSFHPSYRGDKWKIYERVLSPFRQFFEKYKTFDVISAANKTIK